MQAVQMSIIIFPSFQRPYSWQKDHWEKFLDDIERGRFRPFLSVQLYVYLMKALLSQIQTKYLNLLMDSSVLQPSQIFLVLLLKKIEY